MGQFPRGPLAQVIGEAFLLNDEDGGRGGQGEGAAFWRFVFAFGVGTSEIVDGIAHGFSDVVGEAWVAIVAGRGNRDLEVVLFLGGGGAVPAFRARACDGEVSMPVKEGAERCGGAELGFERF